MLNKVNALTTLIDRLRLLFWGDQELRVSLQRIMGFYPHDISHYKLALMHKSLMHRSKGRPANNERLEFLGDAILDAAVGDIVYRHFPGKREGFLTNTRSKLVQRETLGKLAKEMGLHELILSSGHTSSHNSYMAGNAFEALVGAIYLDRGYDACMTFLKKRILSKMINIDKVAYKEVNFKSKLIEWTQKNKVKIEFVLLSASKDDNGSPVFSYCVKIEGVEGCSGKGFSKKESQQKACKDTLQRLRREPQFIDEIFAAKSEHTRMEEEPVEGLPQAEEPIVGDAEPEKPLEIMPTEVYTEEESLVESASELRQELNDDFYAAPEPAAPIAPPTPDEVDPDAQEMLNESDSPEEEPYPTARRDEAEDIIAAAEREAFENYDDTEGR